MSATVTDRIASCATVAEVGRGAIIFSKGDDGDRMYVVADGGVRIHDGAMILNDLGPGAVFGEMAVLDCERRSASATALATTTLICLDRHDMTALVAHEPAVAEGIIQVLTHRLRERVRDKAEDFGYFQEVARLTDAARSLETGSYHSEQLATVVTRGDALGQLARVFQRMADEVLAREQRLHEQVRELRIEIDRTRQAEQVSEIIGSDYFRRLKAEASSLREDMDGAV